jgi:pilus assembly protein Flp/PilA
MSEKKTTLCQTLALLRRRLADNEDGATAIEYAIVASGVGVAVAATVFNLGSTTKGMFASLLSLFQ